MTATYGGASNFLGDDTTLVLTVVKATPRVVITAARGTYGKTVPVKVTVTGNGTPGGTVQIKRGSTVIGAGTLTGGVANITLPAKSVPPGTNVLAAVYSGDGANAAKTQAFSQVIDKASSSVAVKVKPGKIKKNKTKAKVKITVSATGVVPTGKVKVKVKGREGPDGDAEERQGDREVRALRKPGKKNVKVKYLGDTYVSSSGQEDEPHGHRLVLQAGSSDTIERWWTTRPDGRQRCTNSSSPSSTPWRPPSP